MSTDNADLYTSSYHGHKIAEEDRGIMAGYAALTRDYNLAIPPSYPISLISPRNRKAKTPIYKVFPQRYLPKNELFAQLSFALKYEGVQLLVLKKLFSIVKPEEIISIIESKPSGKYARSVWYLYEWLLETTLPVPDAKKKINYTLLADPRIQYTLDITDKSERHRITNNLLGTREYCPHVLKTPTLLAYEAKQLGTDENQFPSRISKSIMLRASAFLLLKDSQSTFAIEGEHAKPNKLSRWGKAVSQAGAQPFTTEEIIRLQQLVLPSKNKVTMGIRKKPGGFIGDYDRDTAEPIPAHISAKWEDLDSLLNGLIKTSEKLYVSSIDAVISAAIISFGFVFIHPLWDGNGRIHRYLIHHILARKQFSTQGMIFPVSAAIHERIDTYKQVLEKYSLPLQEFIEWETNSDKNPEVTNETADYYRYFDATHLAEYLYSCVEETIVKIIPDEIKLIQRFDEFKEQVEEESGLPDNKIKLLWTFLLQNDGKLSKSKRQKFFEDLTDEEVTSAEEFMIHVDL